MRPVKGAKKPAEHNEDETIKQLNRSGFPFQLRIEYDISNSQAQHGWEVLSREHPWRNSDNESRFIDLVLGHKKCAGDRLVIECKRVKADDSRQLQWLFLLPDKELKPTSRASCMEVAGCYDRMPGLTEWNETRLWDTVEVLPSSPESEFCVLAGDDSKRQPILEALCAEVVESTEGLAQEEIHITKTQSPGRSLRFIFPVIVTNATLTVCQFKSSDVKVTDGTLDTSKTTLHSVKYIRFRKSLDANFPKGRFGTLNAAQRAREQTVFIVNVEGLPGFLKDWQLQGGPCQFAIDGFASKFDLWPRP